MIRLRTFGRIAREIGTRNHDGMMTRGVRELIDNARRTPARRFAYYVLKDVARYALFHPKPIHGETAVRARLAARWLARAQDATPDGGLSYGYFPFKETGGWRNSYPETTGYTIPTLLSYADSFDEPEYRQRARRMAVFVRSCQLPSGAIYGGMVGGQHGDVPVAFNTGMALLGLLAAYRDTGEEEFRDSIRRAAEFLLHDVGSDGHFHSHGRFVMPNAIKTYTCLCAWPLYEAGRELRNERYCEAAVRVGNAALGLQQANGWFSENCLSHRAYAPLLHTIGYTLQGFVELGIVSGETRYVEAARRGVEGLLPYCNRGFLYGRWFADWQPAALSSCLTGAAQVAVVCYRLAEYTGDARYYDAAEAVLNYLKALQQTSATSSGNEEIIGAIGGSFPLLGAYMPNGYPGWAVKFYLDALLQQHRQAASRLVRATERSTLVTV